MFSVIFDLKTDADKYRFAIALPVIMREMNKFMRILIIVQRRWLYLI
jgi:hypothetical protein